MTTNDFKTGDTSPEHEQLCRAHWPCNLDVRCNWLSALRMWSLSVKCICVLILLSCLHQHIALQKNMQNVLLEKRLAVRTENHWTSTWWVWLQLSVFTGCIWADDSEDFQGQAAQSRKSPHIHVATNIDFRSSCWLLAWWHLSVLMLFETCLSFWCCSWYADIQFILNVMIVLIWYFHSTGQSHLRCTHTFKKVLKKHGCNDRLLWSATCF